MKKVKFTLLELLVVISIIVILMALLLPALQRSKAKGREVVCASNLKQIGYAFVSYIDDYSGWYPQAGAGGGMGTCSHGWGNCWFGSYCDVDKDKPYGLYSYVLKKDIWKCPSDKIWQWSRSNISYGYNTNRFRNLWQKCSNVSPNTLLVADTEDDIGWEMLVSSNGFYPASMRHHGGASCLFADGHVKWNKVYGSVPIDVNW